MKQYTLVCKASSLNSNCCKKYCSESWIYKAINWTSFGAQQMISWSKLAKVCPCADLEAGCKYSIRQGVIWMEILHLLYTDVNIIISSYQLGDKSDPILAGLGDKSQICHLILFWLCKRAWGLATWKQLTGSARALELHLHVSNPSNPLAMCIFPCDFLGHEPEKL